jgi:hypothetical protein
MKKVLVISVLLLLFFGVFVFLNRMSIVSEGIRNCYDSQTAFFQKYLPVIKSENWNQEKKCVNHRGAVELILSCYESNRLKNGLFITDLTLKVTKLWKPEVNDTQKDFNGGIVERHNKMCENYPSTLLIRI